MMMAITEISLLEEEEGILMMTGMAEMALEGEMISGETEGGARVTKEIKERGMTSDPW